MARAGSLCRWAWPARWSVLVAAILCCVAGARAQEPARPWEVTGGHGWMTIRVLPGGESGASDGRMVLKYLPPRLGGGGGGGGAGALGGVIRPATEFDVGRAGGVDAIVWVGANVYLVLPEERRESGGLVRRVLTLSAVRSELVRGEFVAEDRARVLPSLASAEGGSDVGGAAAVAGEHAPFVSLVVLMADRDGSLPTSRRGGRLMALGPDGWVGVDAPWDLGLAEPPMWGTDAAGGVREVEGETARVLTWRGGVGLVLGVPGEDRLSIWVGRPVVGEAAPRLEWKREERLLTGAGAPSEGISRPLRLVFVEGATAADDALIDLSFGADGMHEGRLVSLGKSGPASLAKLGDVPRSAMMIPMSAPAEGHGVGRIAMVSRSGDAKATERMTVQEISATTGATLYSGPARGGENGGRRLQAMAIIGVLSMVGVLVFVLRGPSLRAGGEAGSLAGIRVGGPLRRLGAAAIDYVPGAIVASLVLGRDATALLVPSTMFGSSMATAADMDLGPLGLAIALTILHTSVLEWRFGRSLGKFAMGLRVVDVRERVEGGGEKGEGRGQNMARPALWQALVRNVVRWCAPLLAVFALLDEAGRHPGDLAARTLVVADENDGDQGGGD